MTRMDQGKISAEAEKHSGFGITGFGTSKGSIIGVKLFEGEPISAELAHGGKHYGIDATCGEQKFLDVSGIDVRLWTEMRT